MTDRPNSRRTVSGSQQYVRGDSTTERLTTITNSVIAASRNGNAAAVRALRRALNDESFTGMQEERAYKPPPPGEYRAFEAEGNSRPAGARPAGEYMAAPSKQRKALVRAASKKKKK